MLCIHLPQISLNRYDIIINMAINILFHMMEICTRYVFIRLFLFVLFFNKNEVSIEINYYLSFGFK